MNGATLFADPLQLAQGLGAGLVFGFLLYKARVTKAEVILNQFLLRDFTVLKVMLSAVVVGGIGVYTLAAFELLPAWHIKSAAVLPVALGGAIFGIGMVVLGYCPGTGLAAMAEGAKDARFGVLGMIVGAMLYAEVHPWVSNHLAPVLDLGKVTLPEISGLPSWLFFGLLLLLLAAIIRMTKSSGSTADGTACSAESSSNSCRRCC
ncbi:MAG: YeeE/YedE family protein [Bdellovibrionales bacterium]|nr:YeeE/YedE family protein [Bdellovibrionales bacterium]